METEIYAENDTNEKQPDAQSITKSKEISSPKSNQETLVNHIFNRDSDEYYDKFEENNGPIALPDNYKINPNLDIEPVFSLECNTNKCIFDMSFVLQEFQRLNSELPNIDYLRQYQEYYKRFECPICNNSIDWLSFNRNEQLRNDVLDLMIIKEENNETILNIISKQSDNSQKREDFDPYSISKISSQESELIDRNFGKPQKEPTFEKRDTNQSKKLPSIKKSHMKEPNIIEKQKLPDINEELESSRIVTSGSRSQPFGKSMPNSLGSLNPDKSKDKITITKDEQKKMMQNVKKEIYDELGAQEPDSLNKKPYNMPNISPNDPLKNTKMAVHNAVKEDDKKEFELFYSQLWYFYYYDPEKYKLIWKTYETNYTRLLMRNAGLDYDEMFGEFQENFKKDPQSAKKQQELHEAMLLNNVNTPGSKITNLKLNYASSNDTNPIPEMDIQIEENQGSPIQKYSKSNSFVNKLSRKNTISNDGMKTPNEPIFIMPSSKNTVHKGQKPRNLDTEISLIKSLDWNNNQIRKNGNFSNIRILNTKKDTHNKYFPNQPHYQKYTDNLFNHASNNPIPYENPKISNKNHNFTDNITNQGAKEIQDKNIKVYPELFSFPSEPYQKTIGLHSSYNYGVNMPKYQDFSDKNILRLKAPIVTIRDLVALKKDKYVNENLINYYLKYIKQKQDSLDSKQIQKYSIKTHFFGTDFYRALVSDLTKDYKWAQYEKVKHHTSTYRGQNNTIFDVFDIIMFIVIEKKSNKLDSYKLVVAYPKEKLLQLYDPFAVPEDIKQQKHKSNENNYLNIIADYINMEQHEKSYGSIDINIKTEWKLDVADLTPTYNWDFSGLFVCQYIHQILKGVRTPFFNNKIVMNFAFKIEKMVEKRIKK